MVAYSYDTADKALGVPFKACKVVHGKPILEGSICVQITQTSASYVPVPIVLGHPKENTFLQAGMFFVIPKKSLFHYIYNKGTHNVQ